MTFMQKLTAALVLFGLFASIYLLNEGASISATAVNTGLIVVFSIMVCAFYFLIEPTKKLIDYIRWYFGFTYGYKDKVLVLGIGIGYIKGVINGNMYLVEFPNHPLKIVSHEDITRIYRRGKEK